MGKPLDFPSSFRPISFTSCLSKLFERIILSRLLFFLESNSILFPPVRFTLDQIFHRSQSILDGFNPGRALGRFSLLLISLKLLTLSGIPPFSTNSFRLASLCFARWTQSFLSDRRACVVFQNHQSRSFGVHRSVPQGSVLSAFFCQLLSLR